MTEVFYAIGRAGFQGSIVILAVLILRLLLKKAPRGLFCLLWLLAGLRLALPFEIQSPFSLQPRLEETNITTQAEKPVQNPADGYFDSQPQQNLSQQSPELPEIDWEDIPPADPRKAAGALGWAVSEMENRYKMFADRDVRNIEGYNKFVETLTDEPEVKKMPRIVIIIDELADLMMTAPKEVEDSINRIAAKARAAGIHLLIATQRPSVNVVTGVIKANIPTRIAFAVSSHIDSATILDCAGAEKLLGRGDMLFSPMGANKPFRIQGCFVSDEEVERVVEFVKSGGTAKYDDNIMIEIERQAAIEKQQKTGVPEDAASDEDPVLDEAIKVVVELGQASTSLLQRKLKLGYARAARIIDQMEERGIIGGYEGAKPRQVLITPEQLMEMRAGSED